MSLFMMSAAAQQVSAPTTHPRVQSALDWASTNGYTAPTGKYLDALNAFITTLDDYNNGSLFTSGLSLSLFASQTGCDDFSRYNYTDDGRHFTFANGQPTFVQGSGFRPNGSSSLETTIGIEEFYVESQLSMQMLYTKDQTGNSSVPIAGDRQISGGSRFWMNNPIDPNNSTGAYQYTMSSALAAVRVNYPTAPKTNDRLSTVALVDSSTCRFYDDTTLRNTLSGFTQSAPAAQAAANRYRIFRYRNNNTYSFTASDVCAVSFAYLGVTDVNAISVVKSALDQYFLDIA